MKFHDFSPFYRSGEGIRSKVSGDRLIDNPAVADAQGGSAASYSFDGTDDVVTGPTSTLYDNAFASGGTISAWVNPSSLGENVTGRIAQKGDQGGANGGWLLCCLAQSGNNISLRFQHLWSTGDVYADSGYSLPIGQWTHVAVHYDGSSPSNTATFYFNGVADVGTNTNSGSGTVATDDSTPLYIGDRSTSDKSWDGQISQVRLHNRALSAAEVRAAYNGQAVPYEYVGGSQTNLVYNTFTNDVFSNGWAAQGATITYDAGNDRVNFTNASGTSSGYHGMYWTFGSAPESGKKYRYSYTVVNHTEGTHAISIGNGTWSPAATGNGTFTGVIESSSSPDVYIRLYPQTAGTDNSFGINSVSVTQIGCVAEYLPSGINSTRWMDTSGNGLHGTTSTATAVNHKIGSLTLATLSTDAVTFDSASGTTTSSTLDHFEQGTWAPVLSDGTNNATMHANNIGTYTRIGSTVFVNAQVMVSSLGSVSGNVRITGLPYQPATTTDVRTYWAAASVTHGWSLAITANQSVGGFIRDNQSYIELRLWDATGGTTELQHSEVTADGELMIHAMYYC